MASLRDRAKIFGADIDAAEFDRYAGLLLEWNEKFNLTAITDRAEIDEKHFLDSLSLISTGKITHSASIIDIGAGAGFPSLPIKLAMRGVSVTMLDALQKRVDFLNMLCAELNLENAAAIHLRAEDAGRDEIFREKYDVALARAVAELSTLAEYALPLVKQGGYFLAMKGPDIDGELEGAKAAIKLLGGKTEEVKKITIGDFTHSIIVIRKIAPTPAKYPRKTKQIKEKPLA